MELAHARTSGYGKQLTAICRDYRLETRQSFGNFKLYPESVCKDYVYPAGLQHGE